MCVDASLNSIQDLLARWRGGGVTPSAFVVTAPQEEKTHARIWIIRGHQRFEFRAEDRANLPLVSTEIGTLEVLSYFGLHCFYIACPGLSKRWTGNPLAVLESLLLCRTLRIGCLRSTIPCACVATPSPRFLTAGFAAAALMRSATTSPTCAKLGTSPPSKAATTLRRYTILPRGAGVMAARRPL